MNTPLRFTILATMLLTGPCATAAVTVQKDNSIVRISNHAVSLDYDVTSGRYKVTDPASGTTALANAAFTVDEIGWKHSKEPRREWSQVDVEDAFGKGIKLTITEIPQEGYRLTKHLHITLYEEQSFAVLGFSVTNSSKIAARITRIGMIDQAGLLPGKPMEELQVLEGGAGAQPNRVLSEIPTGAHNSLMITGKRDGKRRTVVVGGLHYRDFMRTMGLHPRQEKHFLSLIEDPVGKRVEPGTRFDAVDTLYLDVTTTDPFHSLEKFGMAMRAANKANPKPYDFPTLCGWLVSTASYGEGTPINDSNALVGQMKLAAESGILKYTPVGIRLEPDFYCDDKHGDTQQGWWSDEYWAKYGSLTKPYETFAKFCGKIRELGGVPFTYIQSNMPSNDFALQHPDWMLHNDISRLHAEHRHHLPFVKFDFSDPEFQKHVLGTWRRLRGDGLLGIKFDYPETAWCPEGGFEDKSYSATNAYRKVFELCREGLGDEAFMHERNLGESNAPCLDVTAGIVDLQRVWADSSHFEPEMASRIGLRWYKNRSVFGYYPDGKSFRGMDADQRRTMLTQIGLISGRLELGTSFGRMTADEQRDLTRLYPLLKGTRSFRPVDMLSSAPKDPSVYAYRIDPDWSQIILCNNENTGTTVRVPISGDQADTGSLGHDAVAFHYLYDFWNDRLVGGFAGGQAIEVTLKPYQALSYSLHRKLAHPQFLSTNRHITQGLMDLDGVKWDGPSNTYSGKAHAVEGEAFTIVLATNGWEAESAESGSGRTSMETLPGGLLRFTIADHKGGAVPWSIRWKAK